MDWKWFCSRKPEFNNQGFRPSLTFFITHGCLSQETQEAAVLLTERDVEGLENWKSKWLHSHFIDLLQMRKANSSSFSFLRPVRCAIFIALSCSGTYFHPSSHWSVVFPLLGWLSGPWVFAPLVLKALRWRGCYVAIRDISRVCLRKKGLWIELISSRVLVLHWQKWVNEHSGDSKMPHKSFTSKKKRHNCDFYFHTLMFYFVSVQELLKPEHISHLLPRQLYCFSHHGWTIKVVWETEDCKSRDVNTQFTKSLLDLLYLIHSLLSVPRWI